MRSYLLPALILAIAIVVMQPSVLAAEGSTTDEPAAEISADTIALYEKRCGACHGKDGVATRMAKGSPNLNDKAWQDGTNLEKMETDIADGVGKMKGLSKKLTAEEISAIARYVQTLTP